MMPPTNEIDSFQYNEQPSSPESPVTRLEQANDVTEIWIRTQLKGRSSAEPVTHDYLNRVSTAIGELASKNTGLARYIHQITTDQDVPNALLDQYGQRVQTLNFLTGFQLTLVDAIRYFLPPEEKTETVDQDTEPKDETQTPETSKIVTIPAQDKKGKIARRVAGTAAVVAAGVLALSGDTSQANAADIDTGLNSNNPAVSPDSILTGSLHALYNAAEDLGINVERLFADQQIETNQDEIGLPTATPPSGEVDPNSVNPNSFVEITGDVGGPYAWAGFISGESDAAAQLDQITQTRRASVVDWFRLNPDNVGVVSFHNSISGGISEDSPGFQWGAAPVVNFEGEGKVIFWSRQDSEFLNYNPVLPPNQENYDGFAPIFIPEGLTVEIGFNQQGDRPLLRVRDGDRLIGWLDTSIGLAVGEDASQLFRPYAESGLTLEQLLQLLQSGEGLNRLGLMGTREIVRIESGIEPRTVINSFGETESGQRLVNFRQETNWSHPSGLTEIRWGLDSQETTAYYTAFYSLMYRDLITNNKLTPEGQTYTEYFGLPAIPTLEQIQEVVESNIGNLPNISVENYGANQETIIFNPNTPINIVALGQESASTLGSRYTSSSDPARTDRLRTAFVATSYGGSSSNIGLIGFNLNQNREIVLYFYRSGDDQYTQGSSLVSGLFGVQYRLSRGEMPTFGNFSYMTLEDITFLIDELNETGEEIFNIDARVSRILDTSQ